MPADGFYEWKKIDADKQPYFITTRNKAPFAFAGLWEWWWAKDATGDDPGPETFTILTTEPNALCAPIHNRMPVMLLADEWSGWLGTPDNRKKVLRPFPAERMECWPVGKAVGNVRNQGPDLIARAAA